MDALDDAMDSLIREMGGSVHDAPELDDPAVDERIPPEAPLASPAEQKRSRQAFDEWTSDVGKVFRHLSVSTCLYTCYIHVHMSMPVWIRPRCIAARLLGGPCRTTPAGTNLTIHMSTRLFIHMLDKCDERRGQRACRYTCVGTAGTRARACLHTHQPRKWFKNRDLEAELKVNGGLIKWTNFLPADVAEGALLLLSSIPARCWDVREKEKKSRGLHMPEI